MAKSKTQAYRIYDGDSEFFVRGTTDPVEALALLLDEYPEIIDDMEPGDYDLEPRAKVTSAGYFRFNPCTCGEHGWHLGGPYATGGRGRFLGCQVDVEADEVEHDFPDFPGAVLTEDAPDGTLSV